MACRHGSKKWHELLQHGFGRKPHIAPAHGGYSCSGGTMISGWGKTPEDAYVDHVEEALMLAGGVLPKGPPSAEVLSLLRFSIQQGRLDARRSPVVLESVFDNLERRCDALLRSTSGR